MNASGADTPSKPLRIDSRLHARLKERSDLTGVSMQRIVEDLVWPVFADEQPDDVRKRLQTLAAAA